MNNQAEPTPFAILQRSAKGNVVECVEFVLTAINSQMPFGEGTLQTGTARDADGHDMPVAILDRAEITKQQINHWFRATSTPGAGQKANQIFGVQVGEYKEKKRLEIKGRAIFEDLTQPEAQQPPPPPRQQAAPQRPAPPPQRQQASSHIHGQTVGMALNNASRIIESWNQLPAYYATAQFATDLCQVASAFIKASQRLEGGQLSRFMADAPPAQRQAPPPPPRQQAPQPQPEAQYSEEPICDDGTGGDDIPF